MVNTLKEKILQRKTRVAVIGLGYVGLPLAVEFAKNGLCRYRDQSFGC